jgi:hypothetical protein
MSISEINDSRVILSGEEFRQKIGNINKILNPEKGTYEVKFIDEKKFKDVI